MEAKVLALVVIEASTLPDHETKTAVVVSAAVAIPIKSLAEGFNYCQGTNLVGREESESGRGVIGVNRL